MALIQSHSRRRATQAPALLHHEITRHGKAVWYFRRGKGPRVRMPGEYGSAEFLAAYDAALNGSVVRRRSARAGTFLWGLLLYRQGQAWAVLSPATRRQRDNIFKGIENTHGDTRLSQWKRGDIAAGRDKRSETPHAARHFVAAMRGLFTWLVDAGHVASDPTEGVKVARPKAEGFAVWTEADCAAYRAHWPLGTRQRVAFEVLRETGLRRGDACRVGRPHVGQDGVIRIDTEKTGERVFVPMSDGLAEALAAGPVGDLTFITTSAGRPYVKEAFGNEFREWCNAVCVKKSAHGIRKAAATADALVGYSDAELDAK